MISKWQKNEIETKRVYNLHEETMKPTKKHEIKKKRSWDFNEESRNLWINRCDLEEESIRSTWKDHDI